MKDLKEEVYDKIKENLMSKIDRMQIAIVMDAMAIALDGFRIERESRELVLYEPTNERLLNKFIVSKAVEGLSDRSLETYRGVITSFLKAAKKNIKDITTDDIRVYIAYKKLNKMSGNYLNLIRRSLSSLFQWCVDNGELGDNPVRKIKAIRTERKVRKSFTEDEMELLRFKAEKTRDKAIIEFLYSTGCRVSEMCNVDRLDVDFELGKVTVLGKGRKYRDVYLSARCKAVLKEYLDSRSDDLPALFVSAPENLKKGLSAITPKCRLSPSGVESMLRVLGRKCGIDNVHPHRFRRTAATLALKRGMAIEQVQKMLGHESIETTTIYAQSNMTDVQVSHNKYII